MLQTVEPIVFDLETTGVNTFEDRIVTAFIGVMDRYGNWLPNKQKHWLVDPGVEIPEGASNVHGITTEYARNNGGRPADMLALLHAIFTKECVAGGRPLVVYNATYDLTMVNEEFARHGLEPINWWGAGVWVMDPMVIDAAIDKWRKGGRKLVDVAPVYGVPVEANAHDAAADCLMAGRIALAILYAQQYAGKTPQWWMESQRTWKAERDLSYQSYRRGHEKRKPPADQLDPSFTSERGWPVRERP